MAVSEPIPTKALDEGKRIKLLTQAVNEMLIGEDSAAAINGGRTEAEIAAGVVPVNLTYPPGDVRRYGAALDGVTNNSLPLTNAVAVGGTVNIDYSETGDLRMVTNVTPAAQDIAVNIDPAVVFSGAGVFDFSNLLTALGAGPNIALEATYKDVDSTYDPYVHLVGKSVFLRGTSANVKTVALYANSEVAIAGHSGFGSNFGCYVTAAGTGVACEIDSHVTHVSGLGTALAIDAVGDYPSQVGIVIQNNSAAATFNVGISFNNGAGTGVITAGGSAISADANTMGRFIDAAGITCTLAELELPSFVVGPTVAATGIIRIDASASAAPQISAAGSASNIAIVQKSKGTGDHFFQSGDGANHLRIEGTNGVTDYIDIEGGSGGATISSAGSSTNSSVLIQGKGTGGVNLLDGALASKFRVNTTGIGFFATTPAAKPTVTGSRGGNAALASLLTGLAGLGLLTDSTTA